MKGRKREKRKRKGKKRNKMEESKGNRKDRRRKEKKGGREEGKRRKDKIKDRLYTMTLCTMSQSIFYAQVYMINHYILGISSS